MASSSAPDDPRLGLLLDARYRLRRRVGEGGRGVVYEAVHEEMQRRVAVKLLLDGSLADEAAVRRFRREGRAAGRLDHPNVVTVHDFSRSPGGETYLVMEFCEGGSLADELERSGRATAARTAEVIAAVASAVEAAHRAGIVHRDLKPANILVSGGVVKVADFGLAMLAAEDDQASALTGHHAVGSPHYMSPEQAQGQAADARSDVYGLGVIAYEMLTGLVPFSAPSVRAVLLKHITEPPRPPKLLEPSLPAAASAAILRALEKDPATRYPSVAAFASDLVAALQPREGRSDPATKPVPTVTTVEIGAAESPEPGPSRPIGRDRPLAELNQRLLDAIRGRGGFALVGGEPGAGKSTLTHAFLAREKAARPELLTAIGRCSEFLGAGEAYLPFLEAVRELAAQLEPGRVSGFLKTLAPNWARQLPGLATTTGTESDERSTAHASERMPREFTDFLAALSTIRPILLLLEDVHWADRSSVDLLGYLARRVGELRVLVVVTYRPDELKGAASPLRLALRGLSSTGSTSADIAPRPFSPEEVEAFLARELGAEVDPEIVRFVHRRTEGNPLFVVNVLRHLLSLRALRVEEGQATPARPLEELSGEVPEGLAGVIHSRLERLDEEDRRLLQAASVQGEEFDAAAVAAALEKDDLDVEDRLDRLHRQHGLVEPKGEAEFADGTFGAAYRFVHALYQDSLYDSIPPRRRAAWHRAVADTLEPRFRRSPDAPWTALAAHLERARDFAGTVRALETAARSAERWNPREVEALVQRALRAADRLEGDANRDTRTRLLLRLGRHFSEFAEIAGDPALYGRAETAVRDALALHPDGAEASEARTVLALVHLERGENRDAHEDLREVLATDPGYAPAWAATAYLYKNTGLWDAALEAQAEAGRLDPDRRHSIPRLSVLLYQRRWDEAHAEADALLAARPRYSHYHYWKGIAHFYAGDRGEARRWIEQGHELDPDNLIARGVLAFILAHAGEADRARHWLDLASPGAAADGTFTYWIAKVHAALGDVEEAVRWIGRAEALGYWNAPWVATDPALESIRQSGPFGERLASLERKHREFREWVSRSPKL